MTNFINETTAEKCWLGDDFFRAQNRVKFFAYYVITPAHFCFGLPGHILKLIAFNKQRQNDRAYNYQIFSAVSELLETLALVLMVLTLKIWSGLEDEGADWFTNSEWLMWYPAHLAIPLGIGFVTNSQLLSVSMSIDRLLALAKPFQYKNLNHKRRQITAVVICAVLSFGSNAFDAFRFRIVPNVEHGGYKMVVAHEFVDTLLAEILSQFRNFVHTSGLVALIGSNFAMIYFYRKRMTKVGQMTGIGGDDQRELQRKKSESTLFLLTLCQSIFSTLAVGAIMGFHLTLYTVKGFAECGGFLFACVVDITIEVTDMIEFYFVLVISKQFRDGIRRAMPCSQSSDATVITTNNRTNNN